MNTSAGAARIILQQYTICQAGRLAQRAEVYASLPAAPPVELYIFNWPITWSMTPAGCHSCKKAGPFSSLSYFFWYIHYFDSKNFIKSSSWITLSFDIIFYYHYSTTIWGQTFLHDCSNLFLYSEVIFPSNKLRTLKVIIIFILYIYNISTIKYFSFVRSPINKRLFCI